MFPARPQEKSGPAPFQDKQRRPKPVSLTKAGKSLPPALRRAGRYGRMKHQNFAPVGRGRGIVLWDELQILQRLWRN